MDINEVILKINQELGLEIVSTDINGVYDELKRFISKVHPDKFTDDELKQENVGKTQAATLFLTELKKEMERKRISENAVVPYDETKVNIENYEYRMILKDNDLFQLQSEIALKNEEIAVLKGKIKELTHLTSQTRSSQISQEKERVINSFKPKQPSLITAGTVTTLILVYNILGQVEGVSKKLTSYLPVPELVTNICLFSILTLTIVSIGYKFLRADAIKRFLNAVITQSNLSAIGTLVTKGQINRHQIHDFFVDQLISAKGLRRLSIGLWRVNEPPIIEEAIDMIVDYMIANSFIERINVKNMVQNYKVMELTLWDVYMQSR